MPVMKEEEEKGEDYNCQLTNLGQKDKNGISPGHNSSVLFL